MVNFSFLASSLLALAPFASAIDEEYQGSTGMVTRTETFSFEAWVNSIIDDPDGEHLSADQAWEAAVLSWNETFSDLSEGAETLVARQAAPIRCNTHPKALPPANAKDAVTCIDALAARGTQKCPALGKPCTFGKAVISTGAFQDTPRPRCQAVARSCGKIMDRCFRADGTVQGRADSWGRDDIQVTIHGPN